MHDSILQAHTMSNEKREEAAVPLHNSDPQEPAGDNNAKQPDGPGPGLGAGHTADVLVEPALTSASEDSPATSRREIWAWYAYYIGANGLSLFNFGPTAFQNLLSQAAPADTGLLVFAGQERDVNSIVLLANGISFAIQAMLLLVTGAYADFGTGRRWILVAWSLVAFGVGFAWLGVHDPSHWRVAAGLYIVGLIAYQLTLTYWTAAFPSLARNTPRIRAAVQECAAGDLSRRELEWADEAERSRLSNVAFYVQSVGEVVILALVVGVLFGVHVQASTAANNWGISVLVAFTTACWVVLAIPWFVLERTRPGILLPPGRSVIGAGMWQLWEAVTQIWRLRQSLVYLIGYFLLGDSLNTTVTVIATLQNEVVSYDTLTLTYLLIVGIVAQAAGIGGFWLVQKRFGISAKGMFNAVAVGIVLLDGWGMVGNWTDRFGFHHVWEIWLYQAFYGLFVCPWYSYSQILISSVTPRGHEFLFFSLFGIIGKTSSFIGPFVSSAIIDASPGQSNNSAPFYFLFALSLVSTAWLWLFLDLEQSTREQDAFLAQEKARVESDTE